MQQKSEEYKNVMREVETTLRRYDRRFYRRDSLKGAPIEELVTLWRDLRRVHRRFNDALPPTPGVPHPKNG
jgi:hypothetical protein